MIVHDLILATRRAKLTGIERFAINVFEAARARSDDVVALVAPGAALSGSANVITVSSALRGWMATARYLRHIENCRGLVCAAFPAGPSMLASRTPIVRVIHDAFAWSHPENITLQGKMMFAHWERWMLRRYDQVFAPTVIAQEDLHRTFPDVTFRVCGNAPGLDWAMEAAAPVAGLAGGGFLLAVGTIEPRKNYERLIALSQHAECKMPIVVVGRAGWGESADRLRAAQSQPDARIRWLDDVGDAELRWLYRHCAVFVSLSHAEGFNMPLVEAGVSGCRIICSDLPIHRTVAPSWANFVKPTASDADIVATAVASAAPGSSLLADYRQQFDWAAVAQRIEAPLRTEIPMAAASA